MNDNPAYQEEPATRDDLSAAQDLLWTPWPPTKTPAKSGIASCG